jgi:hypothetical protein
LPDVFYDSDQVGYNSVERSDGTRFLVDYLWLRGLKREVVCGTVDQEGPSNDLWKESSAWNQKLTKAPFLNKGLLLGWMFSRREAGNTVIVTGNQMRLC